MILKLILLVLWILKEIIGQCLSQKKVLSIGKINNSYDNAIIKRSVDWAKNRYSLKPIRMPNEQYEIGVNDYSPNNMRVYTIKKEIENQRI